MNHIEERLRGLSAVKCGVIGLGTIGKELVKRLVMRDHETFFCDRDLSKLNRFLVGIPTEPKDILKSCQWVFGCTGRDIFGESDMFGYPTSNQQFVSCSSEDKEFLSILKGVNDRVVRQDVFEDLEVKLRNGDKICVHFGGFPINFSGDEETINPYDIQLTRGLLFSGILQALYLLSLDRPSALPTRVMLDPHLQSCVFTQWLKTTVNYGELEKQADRLTSLPWIIAQSAGIHDKRYSYMQGLTEAI